MAHRLPPAQCSTNTVTWTDPTLTADSTKIRKVHIDELRTAINNELTRRGLSSATWTDPTLTANSTAVKKIHISNLRTQIEKIESGNSEVGYCPEDSVNISWTDTSLTPNSTKPRKVHMDEARTTINALKSGCICETEQCQYCADCGYIYHPACGYCGCQDRCGNDGHPCPDTTYYLCGSINLPSATSNPYKAWDGWTSTAWDGTVPWDWCAYAPPGLNWGTCNNSASYDHSAWSCKCNPYGWY